MPYEGFQVDTLEDSQESSERDPQLEKLWKKFGFFGKPPFKNSPVEKRLYEACRGYMSHVLRPEIYTATGLRGDAENFFSDIRSKNSGGISPSDIDRRALHNQIALMVTGKQRSEMDIASAEKIADFASELIYGCTVEEAEKLNAEKKL